jgi:hypothetical protein
MSTLNKNGSLRFGIWMRRALCAALIVGGVAMATFHSGKSAVRAAGMISLRDEGSMPDLGGAIGWLNSAPLSTKSLRGKVVLVDVHLHQLAAPPALREGVGGEI